MTDDEDLRETLIAAETCIRIAIRQATDSAGPVDEAVGDFQAAIWNLRKWRIALEAGVWTDARPGDPVAGPRGSGEAPAGRSERAPGDALTDHSRAGAS